jgi:hypothetical protein
MKEVQSLILELLENQQELLSNYYDLLSEIEEEELKSSFEENANEIAFSHKELVKAFNEILNIDDEENDDEENDDDIEEDFDYDN